MSLAVEKHTAEPDQLITPYESIRVVDTVDQHTVPYNDTMHTAEVDTGVDHNIDNTERTSNELVRFAFEDIYSLYPERTMRHSYHVGDSIVEDDIVATRLFDESDAEEMWHHTTEYNPAYKWPVESWEVVINHETADVMVRYTEQDGVRVYTEDGTRFASNTKWQRVDAEAADDIVFELGNRVTVARGRQEERPPEERAAADAQARSIIAERYGTVTSFD